MAVSTGTSEQLYERFNEHVTLMAPELHYWKGQYHLNRSEDVTVAVAGHAIEKRHTTTPQVKLLECSDFLVDWKKRFQKIDSSKSRVVEKYSTPFPITGVRVIPFTALENLWDELIGPTVGTVLLAKEDARGELPLEEQSVAYRLKVTADEFCDEYDRVIAEIRENIEPTIWEHVRKKIPNAHVLRGKFSLDVTPVRIAGVDADQQIGLEAIREHESVVQQAVARKVEEAVEGMLVGPRQQLATALENLRDVIARNGKVTERSFRPVREAINKVRLFRFMANEDLLEQINTMEQRLNTTTATSLDDTTAATNGMYDAIEALQGEVRDAEKQVSDYQRFGGASRSIVL